MATIAGSQFIATAGLPVNVGFDSGGSPPPAVGGAFNLEVFVGAVGSAPPIAPGYQGLAVLSPGGYTIDLISGAYAITDNGTGGDSINADGTNETISGGSAFVNLTLNGNNDVANGGGLGGDYIQVNGTGDTVNGGTGPEAVNVNNSGDTVNGGSGSDTITATGNSNVIVGGSGPDTITAIGNGDTITGGTGPDLINVVGTGDSVTGGGGNDTLNVFGAGDTVSGGSGADTIGLYGTSDVANGGSGPDTIILTGAGSTANSGGGNDTINLLGVGETANIGGLDTVNVSGSLDTVTAGASGTNSTGLVNLNGATSFTFTDGPNTYSDTVTGFSTAAGDTIHLTGSDTSSYALAHSTAQNGGADTLITLNDGSTIYLVGVNHATVGPSFFS